MIPMYDSEKLRAALPSETDELFIYEETDSTSTEARRYAARGGSGAAVFLADRQTAGRGRMGRSFYSPEGTGVYLSLLLPKGEACGDALLMTSAAAVAVRRAIFKTTGKDTEIKWVNDLYFSGKRVSGILCERIVADGREHIIVGVGINLSTTVFPKELADIATSLGDYDGGVRQALAKECIRELFEVWQSLGEPSIMEEYRRHSAVLGREISYTQNAQTYAGVAESIDDRGHLHVRRTDGELCILSSGEISVRLDS